MKATRSCGKDAAFSLLEIVVAMAIAALLLGLAAPAISLRSQRAAQMRAAAGLLDACRAARVEAIEKAAPRRVLVRSDNGALVVQVEGAAAQRLFTGQVVLRAQIAGQTTQGAEAVVLFQPSGRTRTRALELLRKEGRQERDRLWRIEFDPVSGQPALAPRGGGRVRSDDDHGGGRA